MIATIEHQGKQYPAFQSEGFAAQFAFPFARKVCKGHGIDIGCNRPEWAYVDADGVEALRVDPVISPAFDAYALPPSKFDYIFSSHCLEHLRDWVEALDLWAKSLKRGGVLFLYLPHPSQSYWRPWHNRKHIHSLEPATIRQYLIDRGWNKIFVTDADLNNSFTVIAEKA